MVANAVDSGEHVADVVTRNHTHADIDVVLVTPVVTPVVTSPCPNCSRLHDIIDKLRKIGADAVPPSAAGQNCKRDRAAYMRAYRSRAKPTQPKGEPGYRPTSLACEINLQVKPSWVKR